MSNIIVPGRPGRPIIIESEARIPPGGTTGQSLVKASDQDYATEWATVTGGGGGGSVAWGDVTGKPTFATVATTGAYGDLTGIPSTFAPSAHTQLASTITDFAAAVASAAPGTNLTYTAATRVIASDTGTDATLPLVTSGDAGLAPASGGGTSNFLRADGTWAATPSAPTEIALNTQAGAYTLVLADSGKYIRMTSATAVNLTVPTNAAVAFPVGTVIQIRAAGAGQITVVASSGVTINTAETLLLRKQGSSAALVKVATDAWDLTGDLETV